MYPSLSSLEEDRFKSSSNHLQVSRIKKTKTPGSLQKHWNSVLKFLTCLARGNRCPQVLQLGIWLAVMSLHYFANSSSLISASWATCKGSACKHPLTSQMLSQWAWLGRLRAPTQTWDWWKEKERESGSCSCDLLSRNVTEEELVIHGGLGQRSYPYMLGAATGSKALGASFLLIQSLRASSGLLDGRSFSHLMNQASQNSCGWHASVLTSPFFGQMASLSLSLPLFCSSHQSATLSPLLASQDWGKLWGGGQISARDPTAPTWPTFRTSLK